jgi:hypothetical protein
MLTSLRAGEEKLSMYYTKTEEVHGNLFAIGTILAPENKLEFFSESDWADNDYEWREKYKRSLQTYLLHYQQQPVSLPTPTTTSSQASHFRALFDDSQPRQTKKLSSENELTTYLNLGISPVFLALSKSNFDSRATD